VQRILFLRTFKDASADGLLLTNLAGMNGTRLSITGDQRDIGGIRDQWVHVHPDGPPFEERFAFLPATHDRWRRAIVEWINTAEAVLLHLSPKDVQLPAIVFAHVSPNEDWRRFATTPLTAPSTGRGLLREICYLNRLGQLPNTILLCQQDDRRPFDQLISYAQLAGDTYARSGRPLTPRMSALDKQLGHLTKAHCAITYCRRAPDDWHLPVFTAAVRAALDEVMATEGRPKRPCVDLNSVVGRSPGPRVVPPDNAMKIIQFSNIEDLFFIPSGELTDVSVNEMKGLLSQDAVDLGCPHCSAPIDEMFFYTSGLRRSKRWQKRVVARCQRCGRRSSTFGDDLAPT
jgi:hypothetical protein